MYFKSLSGLTALPQIHTPSAITKIIIVTNMIVLKALDDVIYLRKW